MFCPRIILPLVLLSASVSAQSVISAHSGIIHYSEGSVFLDDQRVEQKFARFGEMKPGSELRTEDGRAEVLLTPGMFLRIGENSAIRMVSNRLADTRVEFLRGSAVIDSPKAAPGTSVVIVYKDSEIRFRTPGVHRFDSDPPGLTVEEGDVDVSSHGDPLAVKHGEILDALDKWARRRSAAVAANDVAAAEAEDMAVLLESPAAGTFDAVPSYGVFPYIPMIGGYPSIWYGGYASLSPWTSPFYLPRLRTYNVPGYYGYTAYRSGYRPTPTFRNTSPVPFNPPSRLYAPRFGSPSRPPSVPPSAPHGGGVGGRGAGGHR